MIAFGRNLKLAIIGEGIESEGALHYIQEHGCHRAQGLWLSELLRASKFARRHKEQTES
jgi:EAL domain-containing protein (putative c-di-GMP-specific phosphodiesterase class I)